MTKISDIMSSGVVTIEPTATVAEAATVMGGRRVGSLLVMEGERLAGIFTERDIVRALGSDFDAAGHPVEHWMTRDPVTITSEDTTDAALDLMLSRNFRHLPVVDGGKVLGVVSIRDLSAAGAED